MSEQISPADTGTGCEIRPLYVEYLTSSERSFFVNVILIKGEQKAVLVDVPFTRADAHRVVAMILDSGKDLETVVITHDHPDHFFAMEVVAQAFPNAKFVANGTVVADIWRSMPIKIAKWSPLLGQNAPRQPTAPSPLNGDTIMLEGRQIKIIGPMQGDHCHATAIWVPSIRALFPGDLAFYQMYLWMAEHDIDQVAAWGESIDQLLALDPLMVVPGHGKTDFPTDASALHWSKAYILTWLRLVSQSKDSLSLAASVREAFPEAIDIFGGMLLGTSTRVAKGEEPAWNE
jgi:glyoxylase-like metal-dependent hydrolase (beta-lactamase superfamily II)